MRKSLNSSLDVFDELSACAYLHFEVNDMESALVVGCYIPTDMEKAEIFPGFSHVCRG